MENRFKCENCGTTLQNGICPNCQEELYIYENQAEFLPDYISDNFIDKVKQQTDEVRINKEKINSNIYENKELLGE